MDLVGNQTWDLAVTADALAGVLTANKVALYQNDIIPTPNRPLGDYTEATYSGYAKEAITWSAPTLADDGSVEVLGIVGEFRPTSSVVVNSIYGLMLVDTTGAILYAAARFDAPPLPMNSTLDAIIVTVRVRIKAGGVVVTVS